jgi:hypothetical protein
MTADWTYNETDSPPCSATVTSGCVVSFTWSYLSGTGAVVSLKTSPISVCTGTSQPQTCTDSTTGVLPIGTSQFQIVTNSITNTGTAVAGTPLVFTLSPPVTAANATGFSITLQ